jgi:hypothetical protein
MAFFFAIDVKIMFFTSPPFDYAGERSAQGLNDKMIILMSIIRTSRQMWVVFFAKLKNTGRIFVCLFYDHYKLCGYFMLFCLLYHPFFITKIAGRPF